MEVSHPTKLVLAFRSGDKCAICHEQLTPDSSSGNPYKIAVAAHIAGEKYGSVRYDSDMTDTERNSYGNLIYLCANCHTIIDSLPAGRKGLSGCKTPSDQSEPRAGHQAGYE